MNIFYFDEDPVEAAKVQPDKMLVKMVLETAQMLSCAHRELDGDAYADMHNLYKSTHKNHPCSIWVRQSRANYEWLYKHFIALSEEYTERYVRTHLSYTKLKNALFQTPFNIPAGKMTPIAQAMPDEYKHENPVTAYRRYCINEKHYAAWNEMPERKPTWWEKEIKNDN